MQCEDNSKLRTPLSEVCQTTDIGCVPIVDGKPGCAPQPDELPIALDPKTTTLWLFSCKTREWVAFQKFQMCQLNALDLDNIQNICDVLNIGVNYSGTGECQQGTVTLRELAERILECIHLETKIITIGQGDGNKVKISIDGLPLDPVYVEGKNIWSEGGSGTESDPLVVATYDPICKWPIKNQNEVDGATTKHLGACLDGEMARVPFPSKICELPPKNQAQVDAAQSVELGACVDGQEAKIPYIKPSPPVCEANQITLEQASAKGSGLTLVGCDGTGVVRIPVSGSGFFDRDYICVPSVITAPSGAPMPGTGPLRVGCNGEMYAWLCDQNHWEEIRFNFNGLSNLNPDNVVDLCNNFRMMGWYSNTSGDPCVQEVKMNLASLAGMLGKCGLVTQEDLARYFRQSFQARVYTLTNTTMFIKDGSGSFIREDKNRDTGLRMKDIQLNSDGFACYSIHNHRWIDGSATMFNEYDRDYGGDVDSGWTADRYVNDDNGIRVIENPFDHPVMVQLRSGVTIHWVYPQPKKYVVTATCGVSTDITMSDDKYMCNWAEEEVDGVVVRRSCNNDTPYSSQASDVSSNYWNAPAYNYRIGGKNPYERLGSGGSVTAPQSIFVSIPTRGSLTFQIRLFVSFYAISQLDAWNTVEPLTEIASVSEGVSGRVEATMFPI